MSQVVIIEDSVELAESLEDLFTMHGITTTIARNGRTGIAAVTTEHPSVVLLDMRLPDIDGYEVYAAIKALGQTPPPTVIVLTASEATETIAKKIDLPSSHIHFKPDTSLQSILSLVQRYVQI